MVPMAYQIRPCLAPTGTAWGFNYYTAHYHIISPAAMNALDFLYTNPWVYLDPRQTQIVHRMRLLGFLS